ncbi:MAG: hypothetical protein HEQ39_05380 [Rhizobacter sp.]
MLALHTPRKAPPLLACREFGYDPASDSLQYGWYQTGSANEGARRAAPGLAAAAVTWGMSGAASSIAGAVNSSAGLAANAALGVGVGNATVAIAANAVQQGVAVSLGQQEDFDWRSTVAAGVTAYLGTQWGSPDFSTGATWGKFGEAFGRNVALGTVSSVISGDSFSSGSTFRNIALSAASSTASQWASGQSQQAQRAQQAEQQQIARSGMDHEYGIYGQQDGWARESALMRQEDMRDAEMTRLMNMPGQTGLSQAQQQAWAAGKGPLNVQGANSWLNDYQMNSPLPAGALSVNANPTGAVVAQGVDAIGRPWAEYDTGAVSRGVLTHPVESRDLPWSMPVGQQQRFADGRSSAYDYWSDIQESGVKRNSLLGFLQYGIGGTMRVLAGVGYDAAEAAMDIYEKPSSMMGVPKTLVNLGPDGFNAAVYGLKTSLNGWSLLAEKAGAGDGRFEGFRLTDPYTITPLVKYDSKGEAGVGMLTNIAMGYGLKRFGEYSIELNTDASVFYSNPNPFKLVAPKAARVVEDVSGTKFLKSWFRSRMGYLFKTAKKNE